MASNALVFLAGAGTTFVILTAGFSGGWVFTRAAFDDRPAPTRADPGPLPRMRVILPAYAEPAPSAPSVPDPSQMEASAAKLAPIPVAEVSKPDPRTAERQLRVERRRQADRKARKIAAARAKQQMEAQTRQEPGIMAFGGEGPRLFGN